MKEVLGLDIGGVIIERASSESDTSFSSANFLQTPPVPDAFDAIHNVISARFGTRCYLISKCGPHVEKMTIEWLEFSNFFKLTGIPHENIRFCRERKDKAKICDEISVTHFVDDRLEVLSYLHAVPNKYLFSPTEREMEKYINWIGSVRKVEAWSELQTILLG